MTFPEHFKSGPALMHDAVKTFSSSLRDFSLIDDIKVAELDCKEPKQWQQGEKILKILDEVIN